MIEIVAWMSAIALTPLVLGLLELAIDQVGSTRLVARLTSRPRPH